MDELYKQYGQLVIEAEILQGKIQAVKSQIAENLNKSTQPKAEVVEKK